MLFLESVNKKNLNRINMLSYLLVYLILGIAYLGYVIYDEGIEDFCLECDKLPNPVLGAVKALVLFVLLWPYVIYKHYFK